MELPEGPLIQRPSLIVKLRYKYVCRKCRDILSRWHGTSPTFFTSRKRWSHSTRSWLDEAVEGCEESDWTWKIPVLRISSESCRCCAFFLQIMQAIPGMHYGDQDYVRICSELIGSHHVAPHRPRRTYPGSTDEICENTEYKQHYRPNLQIYQLATDVADRTYQDMADGPRYSLTASTFILPSAEVMSSHTEPSGNTDVFKGRHVEAGTNIPLVRSWLTTCISTHPRLRVACDFNDNYGEPPPDHNPCEASSPVHIPDFRLVDVMSRCVVQVDRPTEYAALSYVWGTAKRLLLTTENESWLSTAGVLSVANPDVPRTFEDALAVAEQLSIRYLWIDALCICQDEPSQIEKNMESMDKIYGSAMLTIVSDTASADTGIPGISMARRPRQASFTWAGTKYISTQRTFGEALHNSPWESRAWCLQEKVFSRRLLIFTESQTFYYCAMGTWFEDTVMEQKENISGAIHLREQLNGFRKEVEYEKQVPVYYTAYEAHRKYFGRNFWSLVKAYSARQLSFETDAIRAFSSILKSVEPTFGPCIWAVPSNDFVRGLTWIHAKHRLSLRREGYPSWSWAGWRGNCGIKLLFRNCKRSDADIRVSRGRYRVRARDHVGPSVWIIDWHHYIYEPSGSHHVQPINKGTEATGVVPVNDPATYNGGNAPNSVSEEELLVVKRRALAIYSHTWQLSGHPYAIDEERKVVVRDGTWYRKLEHISLAQFYRDGPNDLQKDLLKVRGIHHNSITMPPLSHILSFYTSVATVFIAEAPSPDLKVSPGENDEEFDKQLHLVSHPTTQKPIGRVDLDPSWPGRGQLNTVVYISRWCLPFETYDREQGRDYDRFFERLNILLIEDVEGWGEVKRRVQMLEVVDLQDWREAEPRWEQVSLA